MRIRDIFATAVQERIEPVVKVADRRPAVVQRELANLVVTPQWERYLHRMLDAYVDAAMREDEQGIGIWISGFFGSGKSLLMKVLGVLLEGGQLGDQPAHQLFLNRLPATSPDRADLDRFLRACASRISATAVGGNLHSMLADPSDSLALLAFKLFCAQQGYTHNWPLAWAVEHQIDARGLSQPFRQQAEALAGLDWDEIAADPEFYLEVLYEAAAQVLPDHFSGPGAVERSVNAVVQSGVTPAMLVSRLRRWCEVKDADGRRHKLLLQLDELGQWIAAGNAYDRTMQVQALAEEAAQKGGGRVWLAVTAHGDIQALKQNVQQENYAKIIQRFAIQARLSNDDISQVVEERVLRKTQPARATLVERFQSRSGELADLGAISQAQRVYPTPDASSFPLFYPYLPWTVAVVPDVVKGIAQAAGRDEALTGSNRTMIGVVQGALIETPGLLDSPVGRVVSLADLYGQLASDVPIETKTDLNRIGDTVPGADEFTVRVARGLFLLGQAEYIAPTLDNVARTVVDSLDASLLALSKRVKEELDKLTAAGYAKRVGDQHVFLSTQQRSFQDKVRNRQDELLNQTYELIQALKDYDSEAALRFDRVAIQGRELALKLEIDGRVVRNPTAHVAVRVSSPLQRALDPQISDDAAMRQLSNQQPDALLFRLADVTGLRAALALAAATEAIADQALAGRRADGGEEEVARQAKQIDLPSHKDEVRRLLGQAVRGGTIFFRGSAYTLAPGDGAGDAARATLAQLLPSIYPRLAEAPQRISNEATAVKAALSGNASNPDLRALGVYKADGTLNESHPLLSALRGKLPLAGQAQQPVSAADLRSQFERPPFGWDGNAVKVGLALLLRASACRLIDSGQVYADPSDPRVADLLSKELSFKGLRVEGVRSDLGVQELLQIRGHMEVTFGVKPALVAATMNNALGEQLAAVASRAQAVQGWADLTQCPLPLAFGSDASLVQELLNSGAAAVRLASFLEQADRLRGFIEQLRGLESFQREQGSRWLQVRDFYNRMVNASVDLPALRRFLDDYRTVVRERTVAEPARWNEIVQAQSAAEQAVKEQIVRWQADTRQRLEGLEDKLATAVRQAGAPEEQVAEQTAALAMLYQLARERVGRADLGLGEASGLLFTLATAEMEKDRRLQELRAAYVVEAHPQAVHFTWSTLAGRVTLTSAADLDQILDGLRERIAAELSDDVTIIIE